MRTTHPKHAVIFGGSGFVGRSLVTALVRLNWEITIITRRLHRHRDLLVIPTVKLIEADNLSRKFIADQLHEADTVVNLVGILNETRLNSFDAVHARLPKDIAEACLAKKVRRLIHISSLGAHVNAPSVYLQSKGRGEHAVSAALEQGLDCIVMRPSVIFGADDSFTRQFEKLLNMAKGFFMLISPNSQMQPVYVGDVVNCIVYAASQQKLVCNTCDIAGPEIFTLYELVSLIDRMCGGRHKIIGLNRTLSLAVATLAQFLPGKPLTPDNLLSLQIPNVILSENPKPFGIQSARFEDTAKEWLGPQADRFDAYRTQAGR